MREVRSSILRLALLVRPNGLVVLCFFLFFLPYSNTTAILVGDFSPDAPRPLLSGWCDVFRLSLSSLLFLSISQPRACADGVPCGS